MSFYDHLDQGWIAKEQGMPHQEAMLFSIAISLQRIALAAEQMNGNFVHRGYGPELQVKINQ